MTDRIDAFEDYTGPTNPNPVTVSFELNEKTWNTVVVDGQENKAVIEEGSENFVVEYQSSEDFTSALARFDGMVPYRILKSI